MQPLRKTNFLLQLPRRKQILDLSSPKNSFLPTSQARQKHRSTNHHSQDTPTRFPKIIAICGAAGLIGYTWSNRENVVHAFTKTDSRKTDDRSASKSSRVFTRREIAQHDSLSNGVWITYKGIVYDITEFIKHHPGGSHTIMMGAGGDVEPFWQTYTVHHAAEVQNLLGRYQIGMLDPVEFQREQEAKELGGDSVENDPYSNDPKRNALLKVLSQKPFNAETPANLLTPTYLTPVEIFFVRNHLPVPEVDVDDYRLQICLGSDGEQENLKVIAEFSLDDLKTKFVQHSVDSVVQCSGNRRHDLKRLKEIKGLDWKLGAIGNARWTGVKLVDLLDTLGIKAETSSLGKEIRHVQLEGLDCDMSGQSYGASISADLAFDPRKNVLLAYEMNGQPLSRDHGFPLRLVAPGVTGARNVKWLGKIILSHEESHSHWQRKDYKSFSPNVDMFNINFDESASIQETPVQSAICEPQEGQVVSLKSLGNKDDGKFFELPVRGYAYSGGGKMIIRVDISIDNGESWLTANLDDLPKTDQDRPDYEARNQTYSWTRWSLNVPIPVELIDKNGASLQIVCRAFDSSYNSQPERPETIWNVRGVVNNSWHKVNLKFEIN